MTLPRSIANRYARALADVTESRGESAAVKQELEQFARALTPGTDAHRALSAPTIPLKEKQKALEAVIGRTHPRQTTANALRVLLRNDRLGQLQEIVVAFSEELDRRVGVMRAPISTAHRVDEEQARELVAALEQATRQRICPEWRIDPDLIGGFRAEVGSTVIDASVKANLDRLLELMAGDHAVASN